MQKNIFIVTITLLLSFGLVSLGFANFNIPTNVDLIMGCTSLGIRADNGTRDPKFKDLVINLTLEPYQKQKGKRSPQYQLTTAKIDLNTGAINEDTAIVAMHFSPNLQEPDRFSAYVGPKGDGSAGRFTSYNLPTANLSEPFIIYGWSTKPDTVKYAIEYRCQIEGMY